MRVRLALSLLFAASLASAAPTLRFEAPEGCPTRAHFEAELSRLLGRSLEAAAPEDFGAEVVVEAERGSRFRVRIALGDARREIDGETCEAVVRAAAIVLGLAIDPEAVSAHLEDETAPPPAPAQPLASASPRVELTRRPLPTPVPIVWGVGARGGVGVGTLPDVHLGGGLSAAMLRGRLRAEIALTWFGRSRTVGGGAGGRLDLLSATPAVCWALVRPKPEVLGCAQAEVGAIASEGVGLAHPADDAALWAAVGGGFGVAWPLGRNFALGLLGAGFYALRRPTFFIPGVGTVHRPSAFGVRTALAVEWRFP